MANSWKAAGTETDWDNQVPVLESKPSVNVWKLRDTSDIPKQDSQSVSKLLQPTAALNDVDSMVTVLSFGGLGSLGMFLSPFLKGRKRTKLVALIFTVTFIAFASGMFIGVRWAEVYASPSTVVKDVLSDVKEASYIIGIDGSDYYTVDYLGQVTRYPSASYNAATVINNAIAALTSGGRIFIKSGSYSISTSLIDNGVSGIEIYGEGHSTVLTLATGVNDPIIHLTTVNDWTIRDMKLDGNEANQTGDTAEGVIFFNAVTRGKI